MTAAVIALCAQLRAVLGGVQVTLVHAVRVRALYALQHAQGVSLLCCYSSEAGMGALL